MDIENTRNFLLFVNKHDLTYCFMQECNNKIFIPRDNLVINLSVMHILEGESQGA